MMAALYNESVRVFFGMLFFSVAMLIWAAIYLFRCREK